MLIRMIPTGEVIILAHLVIVMALVVHLIIFIILTVKQIAISHIIARNKKKNTFHTRHQFDVRHS